MTNSKQEYNDFVRANLPGSIRYDSVRNRYVTANNKYFVTYKEAKWYVDYLVKRGSNLAYAEGGYTPSTILDYSGQKSYVGGNLTSSFDDVVTATRTGLATQLDASGNLVWNAHNLLTYSQDFSNAAWLKLAAGTGSVPVVTANQAIAPDGTLTADQVVFDCGAGTTSGDTSRLFLDIIDGFQTEARVWIRTDSGSDTITLVNQSAQTDALVTDEWQLFTVSNSQTSPNFQIRLNGDVASGNTLTVYIWGAHAYRSDLGGMAPVPLTRRVAGSTTYVPTTSAAVYLPREEAYAYVSGSLVGPYYQKESDARTNLVTYSEDFTNSAWTNENTTEVASSAISPDGTLNATKLIPDAGSFSIASTRIFFNTNSGTAYTASFYLKAGEYNLAYLQLDLDIWQDGPSSNRPRVYVDLSTGTIELTQRSIAASISDIGNGWFRVSLTAEAVTSATTVVRVGVTTTSGSTSMTGDGTSGIYIWGAQLEAAPTPSSYIPTSGSTVTRSADSTTISAGNMPYPTPQVIGPELVTNGTFDDGLTGVSSGQRDCTAEVISGELVITNPTGSSFPSKTLEITTVIGSYYRLSGEITAIASGQGNIIKSDSQGTVNFNRVDMFSTFQPSAISGELFFKATATTTYVHTIVNDDITANVSFDNISVREINPLALSFQMEGLMTYAASTDFATSSLLSWKKDPTNEILYNIDTLLPSLTGQLRVRQKSSGDNDEVKSSVAYFSPGINVPFNIASRHGSTFVNAAVDGTALTALTTPTALPDLSATTFELAPTFNGFIKEFRVWADDIGDSGIAEAST